MLVMLSAAMNAPVKGVAAGRRACLAAMLVEMIHVASLIHDDVIDEADMRRGKPSANARWQSHKAVILGDYILAKNMNIGLQSGQFDLVTHVCGSMAALCEGEVLQDECAANSTMTRQAYLDIIYKKTASLLGVSASAGALAVGATRDRVATMRRFGEAVGMAFQIQDDILDYTPTAHTANPPTTTCAKGKSPCRCCLCSTALRIPAAGSCSNGSPAVTRATRRSSTCAPRSRTRAASLSPPR